MSHRRLFSVHIRKPSDWRCKGCGTDNAHSPATHADWHVMWRLNCEWCGFASTLLRGDVLVYWGRHDMRKLWTANAVGDSAQRADISRGLPAPEWVAGAQAG